MSIFDGQSPGLLGKVSNWMTPERSIAFQGIGRGLSQMAAGQAPDLSASHTALMKRQQAAQQQKMMAESGVMEKFTPEQRAILAQMEPGAAQQIIASVMFREPERVKPMEVNGQLVDPSTGQIIGDYRTPEGQPSRVVVLSNPEEKAKIGLPDDGRAYEVTLRPDGTLENVSGIGSGDINVNNIPPPPSGYMYNYNEDGQPTELVAIPGGPADQAEQAAKNAGNVATAKAQEAIDLAKAIRDDPALASITGTFQGRLPSGMPLITGGQEGANLQVKIDQLQGKVFLEAYESLKGGGPITDVEGRKAEAALARLQKAQDDTEYRKALDDFIGAIERGVALMQGGSSAPDFSRMTTEELNAWIAENG